MRRKRNNALTKELNFAQKPPTKSISNNFYAIVLLRSIVPLCCVLLLFACGVFSMCFACIEFICCWFFLKRSRFLNQELFSCDGSLWNAVWRVLCCFAFGQPTIRFPLFYATRKTLLNEVTNPTYILFTMLQHAHDHTHAHGRLTENHWESLKTEIFESSFCLH